MPLYEFECSECGARQEHWHEIKDRNAEHRHCGSNMDRLPGGHKMLYFEEGRARTHWSMSDKPITSYAQQRKMMKAEGLVEAGAGIPERLAKSKKGPVKPEMKEYMAAQKGRWY